MTQLIKHNARSTDVELLTAILDVLAPAQVLMLADHLRRIKALGYGRVTLIFQNGAICQIQVQETFDFRDIES